MSPKEIINQTYQRAGGVLNMSSTGEPTYNTSLTESIKRSNRLKILLFIISILPLSIKHTLY